MLLESGSRNTLWSILKFWRYAYSVLTLNFTRLIGRSSTRGYISVSSLCTAKRCSSYERCCRKPGMALPCVDVRISIYGPNINEYWSLARTLYHIAQPWWHSTARDCLATLRAPVCWKVAVSKHHQDKLSWPMPSNTLIHPSDNGKWKWEWEWTLLRAEENG